MYCNCRNGCSSPEDLGCARPVDPHCHTWYDNIPTISPTRATEWVNWKCSLCCLREAELALTTTPIAEALGVSAESVTIAIYKESNIDEVRRRQLQRAWEIEYLIELDDPSSITADELISSFQNQTFIASISNLIESKLGVDLEEFETIDVYDSYSPTNRPSEIAEASQSSDSTGMVIGISVGIIALCLIVVIVFRIYRSTNKRKETIRSLIDVGLQPIREDEECTNKGENDELSTKGGTIQLPTMGELDEDPGFCSDEENLEKVSPEGIADEYLENIDSEGITDDGNATRRTQSLDFHQL